VKKLQVARGAELIEMAIVLPLLLFVLAGIIDFGFIFQRFVVLNNAAREGARVAVLPGYLPSTALGPLAVPPVVEERVREYVRQGVSADAADRLRLPTMTIQEESAGVRTVEITVQLEYPYLILGAVGGLMGSEYSRVDLTARARMRLEAVM
jgi:hypothetical protein